MSSIPESTAREVGDLPPLLLKPQEERRLQAGHLWIFSNEVNVAATPLTGFAPGQHVQLRSSRDRFLGYAYVNPRTLISARLLGRDPAFPPGKSLLVHRFKVALALRERLYKTPFYRLAFGEADLLPGLIVDRYGGVLVAQIGTAGMEAMKAEILEALVQVLKPEAVLWKNDSAIRELEGIERYVETALGQVPDMVEVPEGGVAFRVPLASGQKTGWYFDQAANRALFARHARDARVLDVFSYAGSFGLQAARAGASEVTCVDSSESALAAAGATATANGLDVELIKGDAFDMLEALHADRRKFDLIVVDPPAFIKRRKDHPKGLAAYRRLNQLAMQLLDRDGLLLSCSCSYHLAPGELTDSVQRASRHLARFAQLIAVGAQAPDHPVHPAVDETRYLRAFLFRVVDTC
ncbi:MAG TPA: class I SAM-dependent rRNA methyltransferase [Steroidobacteraceae bacterium]|nr:class I SAM-dependent rRNA methyltransferase [Steroidobacteraceae bacterium]